MGFLKFLVIFMAILILAGFSVIVVTIYNRSQLSGQEKINFDVILPENYKIDETIGMEKKIGYRILH